MHLSSLDKMKRFVEEHLNGKADEPLTILDLGSSAIGGCYKSFFDNKTWRYTGIDITPGENVDLVLSDPYNWLEVESDTADLLVSGQTFEHIEFFWKTILEIARVLKPGGLCCIIAPSRGPEHQYPVDCWRFLPDGFRALARYAGLEVVSATTQKEMLNYPDGSDEWGDTVLVARKPRAGKAAAAPLHVYRREVGSNGEDSLAKLIPLVEPESVVLELGPATGYLTAYLKNTLHCRVDCVELSGEMAKEAGKYCDTMLVADLDRIDLTDHFTPASYDCVILADVLEHLKEDVRTLKACRRLLKDNGRCLISIPNAAHAAVIGRLFKERFDYTTEGLLDRTHLRYYTRDSIAALLGECGFWVESVHPVIKLPEDTEIGDSLIDLPVDVQRMIYDRETALCYQFVIVCKVGGPGAETKPPRGAAVSPVDLRQAFTASLNERIGALDKALAQAETLCLERMAQLQAMDLRLGQESAALDHAQKLAWERLNTITALESAVAERQAAVDSLTAEIVHLQSHFCFRAKRALKRMLARAGAVRDPGAR